MKGWKAKILKECENCKYANSLVCKKGCKYLPKLIKNLKNIDIPIIVIKEE